MLFFCKRDPTVTSHHVLLCLFPSLPTPRAPPSRPSTTVHPNGGDEAMPSEAGAGDEELESLLRNFHRVSQGYKDALMEVQALRVNYSTESKKREVLESRITDLQRDNERLRRLYTETLFKFTNQVKFHAESQSLKEELEKANSRLLSMEEYHKKEIEQLKHSNEMNSNALESELSRALVQQATDEAAMKQLKLELSAHRAHIDMLSSR
ncbi:protein At-4/1-like isoform X3 [Phragmites australis]|uniref:protein At-4/1-like isoform X3 n=1 Tax=Phragmites australis TaxID=29695 RepID=UPI002D791F92|nr:protein At-4/1-like isoform X3 [Phragmites australis]